MKKTIALIALTTIAVTACGSKTVYISETTEKTPTPTTQYVPTTQAATMEDLYLTVLYNEYPQLSQLGDAYLLEVGQMLCDQIDAGLTMVDLTIVAIEMEIDSYMLGYIAGAAIEAFCPWNDWFYEGY